MQFSIKTDAAPNTHLCIRKRTPFDAGEDSRIANNRLRTADKELRCRRAKPIPRMASHHKKINISGVFVGRTLGIKEVDDGTWLASFEHYDLGYVDLEQKTLQLLDKPVQPDVVTHVPGTFRHKIRNGAPG